MALILDGKSIANAIREKIKLQVATLPTVPGLAILLVGDDSASHTYVSLKQKACEEAEIYFEKYLYSAQTLEEELIIKIHELNNQKNIHGILVQLPLPNQNADRVIAAIDPGKDVDGFHPKNLEALRAKKSALVPAVALGIMKLIDVAISKDPLRTSPLARGKTTRATIVSSYLFAEPLALLLRERNIISVVTNLNDPDFKQKTSAADILIVALGKPGIITAEFVKQNAIVIDVGTTKINGKLFGDVGRESVEPIVSSLSPVPGGVGPMTVAMLLLNVLNAYQNQK